MDKQNFSCFKACCSPKSLLRKATDPQPPCSQVIPTVQKCRIIRAGFPQQVHSVSRPCHLLGSRERGGRERGPVGTALGNSEPREHISAVHQVLLLLHLLSFLCVLSFPRGRDAQSCAWLQLSKADTAAAMSPATAPSRVSCTTAWPCSWPPALYLRVCHAAGATHPSGTHTWPFPESLTCPGSLSAHYGGCAAASLSQVPLFSYICCHQCCSAHGRNLKLSPVVWWSV